MTNRTLTYLKKFTILIIFGLFSALVQTTDVLAADNCGADCNVTWKECPSGTRTDISADCLKRLNDSYDNCINTMPVAGYVGRVPEDLCLRNRKNPRHNGMDYAANAGTNVTAAADGVVIRANNCSKGYGRKIVIEHQRQDGKGSSYVTAYAHLSAILVSQGQMVKKGDVIGRVGGTSCDGSAGGTPWKAYGNHLHFEIRTSENGTVINPMCDEIQSLCGKCYADFNPNQCRVECQLNPEDPQCKSSKDFSYDWNSFNAGFGNEDLTAAPWRPSTEFSSQNAVVPSSAYNSSLVSANARNSETCDIEAYRNSYSECIFCDLFRVLFNTASNLAKLSYTSLSDAMISLVVIGMALWLAMTILKYISAFDVKEPRTLVKTIFNQAFVVIVVVVILKSDIQEFIDLIVSPVFNTGMALAQLVTSGQTGQTCSGFTQVIEDGGIPASIGNNILCTIQSIQGKILDVLTVGSTSICVAFFIENNIIWLLPHWGYLITGIILWITGIMLMLIYPWLLIDAILQLSIASALIPVAIAAYAFPITRKKYVSKVWETFMMAMFTFLFLTIVIFIITTGIEQIMAEVMNNQVKNIGSKSDFGFILDTVNGLAWWSVRFLKLVFWLLLGWAVLDQAQKFAKSFSKGGFSIKPIGSPFGGMVNNVATKATLGIGGKALEGSKWAGNQMFSGAKDLAHSAKVNRMAKRALNSGNATTNADGSVTATVRNWYGREVKRTVSQDAAGNFSVTNQRSRIKLLGKLSHDNVTTTDRYVTIKNRYGSDGKLLKQSVKINSAACKKMTNKDGSLNMVAVNTLRQNSTLAPELVNTAILHQVLKERMPNSDLADMDTVFASRTAVINDDGSFVIKQINVDGSTTNFSMKIDGDRIMTSVEKIRNNGSAVKYSSDGIINRRSTYVYSNGEIDKSSIKNKYAFSDYYANRAGQPMDANGVISNGVPKDKIMFGKDDLDLMAAQIAAYGQPQAMKEFSK